MFTTDYNTPESSTAHITAKDLAKRAWETNKEHQYALKVHTERLEDELAQLDRLISTAEASDEPDDGRQDVALGTIVIPGIIKPVSLIQKQALLSDNSPFCEDARWKEQYDTFSSAHPFSAKESDALSRAVKSENMRIHALRAQHMGQHPFHAIRDRQSDTFLQNKEGIDWERIAVDVSNAVPTAPRRTGRQYEIRWLGAQHPEFNKGTWNPEELSRLKGIVGEDKEGPADWVNVAKQLRTNRTPIDCMKQSAPRKLLTWTQEADRLLLEGVEIYGLNNWSLVARYVSPDATGHQCQKRYTDTLESSIKRGTWTPDEDAALHAAVAAFGESDWPNVALFVEGRTKNQCRERWQDALARPGRMPAAPLTGGAVAGVDSRVQRTKSKWTNEEDEELVRAVDIYGRSWKVIGKLLSRDDNVCRRRFDALLKKQQTRTQTPQSQGASTPASEPNMAGPSSSQTPSTSSHSIQPPDGLQHKSRIPTPVTEVLDDTMNMVAGSSASGSTAAPNRRPTPVPRLVPESSPDRSTPIESSFDTLPVVAGSVSIRAERVAVVNRTEGIETPARAVPASGNECASQGADGPPSNVTPVAQKPKPKPKPRARHKGAIGAASEDSAGPPAGTGQAPVARNEGSSGSLGPASAPVDGAGPSIASTTMPDDGASVPNAAAVVEDTATGTPPSAKARGKRKQVSTGDTPQRASKRARGSAIVLATAAAESNTQLPAGGTNATHARKRGRPRKSTTQQAEELATAVAAENEESRAQEENMEALSMATQEGSTRSVSPEIVKDTNVAPARKRGRPRKSAVPVLEEQDGDSGEPRDGEPLTQGPNADTQEGSHPSKKRGKGKGKKDLPQKVTNGPSAEGTNGTLPVDTSDNQGEVAPTTPKRKGKQNRRSDAVVPSPSRRSTRIREKTVANS